MEAPHKPPEYEVGYGKPPRHTQFKKGQSGNSKGRPRGAKNVDTILKQALAERVVISEKGRRKSLTKAEVIIKQLVNKAAQGDHRSTRLLMEYIEKHQPTQGPLTIADLLQEVLLPEGTTRQRQAARAAEVTKVAEVTGPITESEATPVPAGENEKGGIDDALASLAGGLFDHGNGKPDPR